MNYRTENLEYTDRHDVVGVTASPQSWADNPNMQPAASFADFESAQHVRATEQAVEPIPVRHIMDGAGVQVIPFDVNISSGQRMEL